MTSVDCSKGLQHALLILSTKVQLLSSLFYYCSVVSVFSGCMPHIQSFIISIGSRRS